MKVIACPLRVHPNSLVVENILKKKELLDSNSPSHQEYKTALVIEGGIMLGVYGGGVVTGLEELGLTDVFDYVIGISAGAGIASYFLGGNARVGNSIFYEDLNDLRFINPFRFKKVLDLDYLETLLRTVKPVNSIAVKDSRSELLIPVTDMQTGVGRIISSKKDDIDLILALKAAMSVPILYKDGVLIEGNNYCDGNMALPNAIEYAIRELDCNNIIIVTNRSCDCNTDTEVPSFIEKLTVNTFLRKETLGFKYAFLNREPHYQHDMGILWGYEPVENVELGLICSDIMTIRRFTKKATLLEQVAKDAEMQTLKLFENAKE